jgi:alpha-beta hydrolase superfamily lysophospholipase
VQWGSDDAYVLKWEIDSVFKAITSTDKKLVVYENAFHESLFRRNRTLWKSEVNLFLENKQ